MLRQENVNSYGIKADLIQKQNSGVSWYQLANN